MKPLRWLALSISWSLLIACAPLFPLRPADNAQIEQWLARHQYGQAIRNLERRLQTRPSQDNRARLRKARVLADAYDRKMADEALRRRTKGDWKGAAAVLDEALTGHPGGKRLLNARNLLRREQARRLRQLATELLVAKAEWLRQSAPLHREMARIEPDNLTAAWRAEQADEEGRETAERLAREGIEALSRRDLNAAARYLKLADRIHPSATTTRALARLAQMQAQQQRQTHRRLQHAIDEQRQQKGQQLMAQVRRAMIDADLPLAKKTLEKLSAIDQDNPELVKLERALDTAIDAKVNELTEHGSALYSKGRIRQAKQAWESALELDPGNRHLAGLIARAERVLKKLHKLQQRDTGGR